MVPRRLGTISSVSSYLNACDILTRLDIMASTSSQLERGYEKIFRWCSFEFQQIGRDTQLEVGATMQEAVRRLRKRPELLRSKLIVNAKCLLTLFYSEALTFLSHTRQATLLSTFLAALTRGGPSGLPRPIELHAHDPIRYVGDMLAWVHQAIAAEREFLEALFGLKSDRRMVGSIRIQGGSEEEEWIQELMDLAVGKLCVPLRVRCIRICEDNVTHSRHVLAFSRSEYSRPCSHKGAASPHTRLRISYSFT